MTCSAPKRAAPSLLPLRRATFRRKAGSDLKRMMLSIGYNVEAERLEESCYDLLGSEARSAVFVAIAKGDIPQESWFRSEAHDVVDWLQRRSRKTRGELL